MMVLRGGQNEDSGSTRKQFNAFNIRTMTIHLKEISVDPYEFSICESLAIIQLACVCMH